MPDNLATFFEPTCLENVGASTCHKPYEAATGYMNPEKSIPYKKINKVYSFLMIKLHVICAYLWFNTAAIQRHLIGRTGWPRFNSW